MITAIEIENFRSIRALRVEGLLDYESVLGLNSSGKSNVLRALNLFFNDRIDDDAGALVMARDFSDYAPKGRKRMISVGVELSLRGAMTFRGQKEFLQTNELVDTIAIRRTWSLSQTANDLVSRFSFGPELSLTRDASPDEEANLQTVVRSIIFRYIPNHARPADLIADVVRPLRSELVSRLQSSQAYRSSSIESVMEALLDRGLNMFRPVSDAVGNGVPGVSLAPDLPGDFADLAFDLALRATSRAGIARPPDSEGSGAQSFMLLHALDLADGVARQRNFGWVQAAVWAIEEPESFLHAGLRTQFSSDLYRYATESDRRQVFVTTHSDDFVRVGSSAWIAEQTAEGTTLERMAPRDAIIASHKRAIASYAHPLFENIESPIVIPEGKFDVIYLTEALRAAGIRPRWKLVDADQTLGDGTGGDALRNYLRWNANAIASRPDRAPVVVLRDWEDAERLGDLAKVLKVHPYSRALACDVQLANPDLGDTFRGIERYLPTSLIREIVGEHALGTEPAASGGKLSVSKSVLSARKQALAEAVEAGADVGEYMLSLAVWLNEEIEGILQAVPTEAFL